MDSQKYKIDMCSGPLLWKMVLFAIPLYFNFALQTLFNAADMLIIGRFSTPAAMAAIGVTLNPITLFLKIFIGFATGTNVVMAYHLGAKNDLKCRQCVHTAMSIALYGGIILMTIAIASTKMCLVLMKTPAEILSDACIYMWIYFLGVPFLMAFNFGCAILQSLGDSRRPLYFLIAAGITNVLLNLFFVAVCKMTVAGVAIATTLSNGLAAFLILRTLTLASDKSHLNFRNLKIHWDILKAILLVGVPAAVNSSLFNLSNMIIQTAVNSFGTLAIAGCTICVSIEGFVTLSSSAFQQTVTPFVAQNFGATKYTRVVRCCVIAIVGGAGFLLVGGFVLYSFGKELIGLFNSDSEVIRYGLIRMKIMLLTMSFGCIMDVLCGCLRGIGHPVAPTCSSLFGACFLRVAWIFWIFPIFGTLESIYMCYPVSWIIVSIVSGFLLYHYLKKVFREELHKARLAMFP